MAKPLRGTLVSINDYALSSFERPDFDTFIVKGDTQESFAFLQSIMNGEHEIKTLSDCGILSGAKVTMTNMSHENDFCATFAIVYKFNKFKGEYEPQGGYYEQV